MRIPWLFLALVATANCVVEAAASSQGGRVAASRVPADNWLQGRSRRDRRRLRRAKDAESAGLVLPKTELSTSDKRIWIVTTASLPWMTGTSINPLLRAAYLARGRAPGMVTLMLPFLEPEDQHKVFPANVTCATPDEQAKAARDWLARAGLEDEARRLRLVFYPGRYHKNYGSIFPMGDITTAVPRGGIDIADICILEEPEHLNWYRAAGPSWRSLFPHVVGVVHTNYLAYSSGYGIWAPVLTFMLRRMNVIMARAYCDRIIKLSAVIQEMAPEKEVVCNVHGVRECFLKVGDTYSRRKHTKGAYFIGKSLWAKGHGRLLELWHHVRRRHPRGDIFHIDVYGNGPDKTEIEEKARRWKLPVAFHPATDHAKLEEYKVFVNPSLSEVLCTTVAEALAMGKWVVCSDHVSNHFFYQFPNCLTFKTSEEFAACVSYALRHEPAVLTQEQRRLLSWEAATDRLLVSAAVTVAEQQKRRPVTDGLCRLMHTLAIGRGRIGDFARLVAGAENCAGQSRFVREAAAAAPAADAAAVADAADAVASREMLSAPFSQLPLQPAASAAAADAESELGGSRGPGRPAESFPEASTGSETSTGISSGNFSGITEKVLAPPEPPLLVGTGAAAAAALSQGSA